MSVGKRLRFEILKRDGYRCRYCGTTAVAAMLQVDHVLAVANGGTDIPENLVTSCSDCNIGKSDVPLEKRTLPQQQVAEDAEEHAEQIRAFLEAQRLVVAAREELSEWWSEQWRRVTGTDPTVSLHERWPVVINNYTAIELLDAMDAVRGARLFNGLRRTKYFFGCLRRRVEQRRSA